jgi:hypothetical protein
MLSKIYKLKGIEPGIVHTRKFGKIDFSQTVAEPVLKELYDSGFSFLELTDAGEKKINKNKKEESPAV